MSLEAKLFLRKYDMNLIAAPDPNIILGDLAKYNIWGKPILGANGVSKNIFLAIEDAGFITNEQANAYQTELRTVSLSNTAYPNIDVEIDVEDRLEIGHEAVGKIEASFGLKRVAHFSFANLQVCELTWKLRGDIDDYIERFKANKWKDYDGKLRAVHLITKLCYGDIKISIKNELTTEFEGKLASTGLETGIGVKHGENVVYTFSHQEAPFAMKLSRVRDFTA